MLELDPAKRISASDALLSNWLKDITDETIQPIQYVSSDIFKQIS
jgi:hypothetical protein